MSKDLMIKITAKNNRLVKERERLGFNCTQMGAFLGLTQSGYSAYENMIRLPVDKKGRFKKNALDIAKKIGVSPEELFPESIRNLKAKAISREVNSSDLLALSERSSYSKLMCEDPVTLLEKKEDESIKKALLHDSFKKLTLKEKYVIYKRFGLNNNHEETLEAIGEDLEVSRERVRQLEHKARAKILRFFRHMKGVIYED